MIKIAEVAGFTIHYETREKKFVLIDHEGKRVASAFSQEKLEEKAKALQKQEFKRVPILKLESTGQASPGEITSINIDDMTMWVVLKRQYTDGSERQVREKERIGSHTGCYEHTEHNLAVAEKIKEQHAIIDTAYAEARRLREQMEKPINLEYFGIKR